jgi:hypothetical protein
VKIELLARWGEPEAGRFPRLRPWLLWKGSAPARWIWAPRASEEVKLLSESQTDQSRIKIKRLERYHSICYLRGALQLRSNCGYPCLCGGGLPAVPFSATSQTRRLQAEAAPAQTGSPRSAVLDCPPWEGWSEALIIVKPETVVSWHRGGFRRFWRWRSQRRRPGRPQVNAQIRQLIRHMKADNPTCGAPRIHGELLQFGFEISEPTVSRKRGINSQVPHPTSLVPQNVLCSEAQHDSLMRLDQWVAENGI